MLRVVLSEASVFQSLLGVLPRGVSGTVIANFLEEYRGLGFRGPSS